MKTTVINPSDGIYPATSDYVHAIEVNSATRLLFCVSLDESGAAPASIDEPLALI